MTSSINQFYTPSGSQTNTQAPGVGGFGGGPAMGQLAGLLGMSMNYKAQMAERQMQMREEEARRQAVMQQYQMELARRGQMQAAQQQQFQQAQIENDPGTAFKRRALQIWQAGPQFQYGNPMAGADVRGNLTAYNSATTALLGGAGGGGGGADIRGSATGLGEAQLRSIEDQRRNMMQYGQGGQPGRGVYGQGPQLSFSAGWEPVAQQQAQAAKPKKKEDEGEAE